MKFRYFLLAICWAALSVSCSDKPEQKKVEPQLEMAVDTLIFDADTAVNFTCNVNCQAFTDQSWARSFITKAGDNGEKILELRFDRNWTDLGRIAVVKILADDSFDGSYSDATLLKTIHVFQPVYNAPKLEVGPSTLSTRAQGGTYNLIIKSNSLWNIYVKNINENQWFNLSHSSGFSNDTVEVTVSGNPTSNNRGAILEITARNGASCRDTILQYYSIPQGETGVEIAGITWATRNIAEAGMFDVDARAKGRLYQFDMLESYSPSNPILPAFPPNYTIRGGDWRQNYDPSPTGWRLPTIDDYQSLIQSGYRFTTAEESGIAGVWFGPNAQQASFENPGQAVFFPRAGLIFKGEYFPISSPAEGYWTAQQLYLGVRTSSAMCIKFDDDLINCELSVGFLKECALPIRCVKQ